MIGSREAVLTVPFRLLSTIRRPTSKYWSILLPRDRKYSGRGVGEEVQPETIKTGCGVLPASYSIGTGPGVLTAGLKRPELKVTTPCSTEVKRE